jgi:hypothetical protein
MPLAVDVQGGVASAWSNVVTFVPKLAAALVIITRRHHRRAARTRAAAAGPPVGLGVGVR